MAAVTSKALPPRWRNRSRPNRSRSTVLLNSLTIIIPNTKYFVSTYAFYLVCAVPTFWPLCSQIKQYIILHGLFCGTWSTRTLRRLDINPTQSNAKWKWWRVAHYTFMFFVNIAHTIFILTSHFNNLFNVPFISSTAKFYSSPPRLIWATPIPSAIITN